MRIVEEDLRPGLVLTAHRQGSAITPRSIPVEVLGIHGPDVRYRIGGRVGMTPIGRFLGIVDRSEDPKEDPEDFSD